MLFFIFFIVYANVFLGMLKKMVFERRSMVFILQGKRTLSLTSFFVDDCLLFARANEAKVESILQTLTIYHQASG